MFCWSDQSSFCDLPDEMAIFEIWLPHSTPVCLRAITVSENAGIFRSDDNRPRWVTYGIIYFTLPLSKFTLLHMAGLVARAKNFNLTSLGFGGQCHADPMIMDSRQAC